MIARTWLEMGMPITVRIEDERAREADIDEVMRWFADVNARFSTYRDDSEVSRLNRGEIDRSRVSTHLDEVLRLCDETSEETDGYFDIEHDGKIDPSGLVKGWAILKASDLLADRDFENYYVDAGGDIQAVGLNGDGVPWSVGIRNPFNRHQVVKVLSISNRGVATSGTAIRGDHIYNPLERELVTDIVSLTVIGPTIYDADRMATAAFAMGKDGLAFIAERADLEGYAVGASGLATFTEGFQRYVR